MGRWTGEAPVEEESEGGGGSFDPAPRGIYKIQVADYKEDKTLTMKDCLKLTCEVAEGDHLGKKVWLTVTQLKKGDKGYGFFIRNLHAFGFGTDGAYDFEPNDWQGATAYALLGVKPYTKVKNGQSYTNDVNFIEQLYTANHPPPDELPAAPDQKGRPTALSGGRPGGPQSGPAHVDLDIETVPF